MTIPAPVRPARRAGRTWLLVHLATLAAGIPVLLWINRDQWFVGDEWEVILFNGLGSNPTRLGLFAPHFEHWSTLGILVYKALYAVFAARTYWPYVAVMIAVILVLAHTTWRLLLRIGVVPWYATAVAALTMIAAVSWENRSNAWQITIVGPVALGFGALLLMPERGPWQRRDAGVVALLVLGLMCSGVGVTMTAVVAVAALLRRGWKVTLQILGVPVAVYAVWYALEGTSGQHNTVKMSTTLRGLPDFVWRGLTSAFSELTRVPGSGAVVLVVLVAWVAWRARPREEPWPLVIATTTGVLASMVLTALRRVGHSPTASRYGDIVVLLALPALALMTQEAGRALVHRFGRPALMACSAIVVAFLVVQIVALNDKVSSEPFVGEMRPRVLATARIMRDHEALASTNIFGIPYLTEPSATTIARLDGNGELPEPDVSPSDLLTAREYLETWIGDASRYPEGVVETVRIAGGSARPGDPGCLAVTPATPGTRPVMRLELPSSGSFRVANDRAGTASLSLVEGDARGRPREFPTEPGGGVGVGVSRHATVELRLPPDTTTLCGLGTPTVTTG